MTRDALLVAAWQARDDIYTKLAAGMPVNQLLYYGVALHALDRFVDDLVIACYESLIEALPEDVLRAATPVVIRNALERAKEQIDKPRGEEGRG